MPLDAPRHGDGGNLVYEWKGKWPAKSRTWLYTKDRMEQLEREGRIVYTRTGTPNLKRYMDETPGLPLQNLWDDMTSAYDNSVEDNPDPIITILLFVKPKYFEIYVEVMPDGINDILII